MKRPRGGRPSLAVQAELARQLARQAGRAAQRGECQFAELLLFGASTGVARLGAAANARLRVGKGAPSRAVMRAAGETLSAAARLVATCRNGKLAPSDPSLK